MIIDVILGQNIDTSMWINELKEMKADFIAVINYDSVNEFEEVERVIYLSPNIAKEYLKNFDTINFYKSLYAYPGMQTNMKSLYKKDKE
ncbi:hypothetical protein [Planococcus beijingensis]|uniref:hypothetical protein n=1 Tax=Planococcus beijingensis TaxID=2782551 RepID=UPI00193C572D|nr:hypothetical protein [Planococcus beijingensis]